MRKSNQIWSNLGKLLIAGSVFVLWNIATNPHKYFKTKEEVSKEIKLNEDSWKAYSTYKDEAEGLRDIRKNVITNNMEDAWIYFPKKNKWCEIGINSKRNKKEFSSKINKPYVNELISENKDCKEVIFYHNHPDGDFAEEPSKEDFEAMIRRTIKIKNKYPSMDVKFKLCTSNGITEFYLTNKGVLEFSKLDNISKSKLEEALQFKGEINELNHKTGKKNYNKYSEYITMNVDINE